MRASVSFIKESKSRFFTQINTMMATIKRSAQIKKVRVAGRPQVGHFDAALLNDFLQSGHVTRAIRVALPTRDCAAAQLVFRFGASRAHFVFRTLFAACSRAGVWLEFGH